MARGDGYASWLVEPRPVWHRYALCRGLGPDLFFPESHVNISPEVRQLCAECPARKGCLEEGLKRRERGVWGGTSEEERREIRRQRREAAA